MSESHITWCFVCFCFFFSFSLFMARFLLAYECLLVLFFFSFLACHDSHELDRTSARPVRGRGIYHTHSHSQLLH